MLNLTRQTTTKKALENLIVYIHLTRNFLITSPILQYIYLKNWQMIKLPRIHSIFISLYQYIKPNFLAHLQQHIVIAQVQMYSCLKYYYKHYTPFQIYIIVKSLTECLHNKHHVHSLNSTSNR